jgi:hypothetical protein
MLLALASIGNLLTCPAGSHNNICVLSKTFTRLKWSLLSSERRGLTTSTGVVSSEHSLTGLPPSLHTHTHSLSLTSSHSLFEVDVEVKLRLTVSRPVRFGVRHPSGTRDELFFPLAIFFRQLRVCYFVAPSLTRGWVCNLLLLLVLASAVSLGSESRGTQNYILLSQFLRLSQPGGPGPRIYILQEQGGPVMPPGTWFPFRRRWGYSIRIHLGYSLFANPLLICQGLRWKRNLLLTGRLLNSEIRPIREVLFEEITFLCSWTRLKGPCLWTT